MNSDKRNTAVIIALLGSLTIGALLLLWMEPRPHGTGSEKNALLAATNEQPVESATRVEFATIEFISAGEEFTEASYDCVVYGDRTIRRLRNASAQIAVVGVGGEQLSEGHRRQLLYAVRELTHSNGLVEKNIRLGEHLRAGGKDLSIPEAADLVAYLRLKRFVR